MSMKRVTIIGAGLGGLSAAIELAAAGMAVTVLERAAEPGGKLRQVAAGGQAIDTGPTALTMRWVFDDLFRAAGSRLEDFLTLTPARMLGRHAWAGGAVLDLYADRARSHDAVAAFAGPRDAAAYLRFCRRAETLYRAWERPGRGAGAALGVLRASHLRQLRSLWHATEAQFRDPRLRQVFARVGGRGGTPAFKAPAAAMLYAHLEHEGVWLVDGGMQWLAVAMTALAQALGVVIRTGTAAEEIVVRGGHARGVRVAGSEVIAADAVVVNGDLGALAAGLLGRDVSTSGAGVRFPGRSLSAVTWAAPAETSGLGLVRQNIFFSGDTRLEFDLIESGRLPTEPTVYVCAQDRADMGGDVAGAERLLLLVNAPANGDRRAFSQVEIEQCMQAITGLLARCGLGLHFTAPPVMTTPATFHRLFPGSAGALYGRALTGWMGGFRRPQNRTRVPGLYVAGGSGQAGAGMGLATLSGRQAAASVIADQATRSVPGWRWPCLVPIRSLGAAQG